MAITSAIKGTIVPSNEVSSAVGLGAPLNDLVDKGIITPTEGGAKFLFNQDYNFGAPTTDMNGVISSSNSAVQGESNIKSTIAGLNVPSPSVQAAKEASAAYIATLDQQNKDLEARRLSMVTDINKSFDVTKEQTKEAQVRETGATNVALQRVGGYLGTQISGVGVLNNLAQTHEREIGALEAKRASAVNEANNAISDKQFALAQLKAKEVKDLDKEINQRSQDFFENALKITTEERQQETFQMNKIDKTLESLSIVDPASVSPSTKSMIDTFYKTPGFTDKYLAATSAAAQAKNQKDIADAHKSYIDLLQTIPTGQRVKMPDGSIITGIGKSSDVEVFNKEDAYGNVTIVSYNKQTHDIKEYSAGQIGTPANAGDKIVSEAISPYAKAFSQVPRDTNGFIQPQQDVSTGMTKTPAKLYNDMYQSFIMKNPGKGKQFFENFPVENYLDQSNRSLFQKI